MRLYLLKGIPFGGTLHVAIAMVNCSALAPLGGKARPCGCRTGTTAKTNKPKASSHSAAGIARV